MAVWIAVREDLNNKRSELVKIHRFPGFVRLFGVAVQICALVSITPVAVGQTYNGSCWTSTPKWPVGTDCDCTFGSGSCYASKKRQFSILAVGYDCRTTSQGAQDCDPGPITRVGVEFDCGNTGYNKGNVFLCAAYGVGMTGTAIAAVLATGGWAFLAAFLGEGATGGMAIHACQWCQIHYCSVGVNASGRWIEWNLNPKLSTIPCPSNS